MLWEFISTLAFYFVPVLIGVVTSAIIYTRWFYGTLEKLKGLGVVAKPSFIGGSDFGLYRKIVHEEDIKNVKKYGKVFGFYEGRAPTIYVADVELIKQIFIKDFEHFNRKREMNTGTGMFDEMIDFLPYDKWKPIRTAITPMLTTARMRSMSEQACYVIQEWMESLKKQIKDGIAFQPKKAFTAVTSDIVMKCFFATKLNCLEDPNNPIMTHLENILVLDESYNFLLYVLQMFPILSKVIPIAPGETLEFFQDLIQTSMKTRKDSGMKSNDFIDLLNEMSEKVKNDEEYIKLGMTETTVMAQAMALLTGGFGTTSETVTLTCYNLARNPEAQKKVFEELTLFLENNEGRIGHESVHELKYLMACVMETLRMFPTLVRIERECTKDWVYEPKGLSVPKGVAIQVPVFAVHYDPEYFLEPDKFKPERFLMENKHKLNSSAFLAFGAGNHNCVGMRFGKELTVLILANILKEFEFKENYRTKLEPLKGQNFILTFKPISLDIVSRKCN